MKHKNNFLLLVLCTALQLCASGQGTLKVADSIRMANGMPALGFVLLSSDSILDLGVVGVRRSDRNNQVTIHDRFHLGSNSKAITAFIAAKLVEENKLKWDTRFFDLFPTLLAGSNKAYENITLSDLLSHRAGIQPFTGGLEFLALKLNGDLQERRMQFAAHLLKQAPTLPKDNKLFAYSNAGYALAAMMLEKASGKTYAQLVNSIMNERLHLNVQFGWPNLADSNQPYGHQGTEWGFQSMRPLTDPEGYKLNDLIIPAGDLNMTLPDYARFIQLFLKGIKGQDNFLKSTTYEYLLFGREEYAMGWLNGVKDQKYFATHDGSAGTFYCHTFISKKLDRAVIIVSNSAEQETTKGIYALRKIIMEKYNK